MTHLPTTLSGKRLTTPRAAAFAGILFAILFTACVVLIRISIPNDAINTEARGELHPERISIALGLMPYAGIAFLWFMGVVRDRLGAFEDQFFSTIFYGSGLLFLAMIFAASADAGGISAIYLNGQTEITSSEAYHFGRAMMSQLFTVYALRMAGVFVTSLGTIWLRTGLMPRWLAIITYVFALILLVSPAVNLWMVLVFPLWVLIISLYILFLNLKQRTTGAGDGMTMQATSKE